MLGQRSSHPWATGQPSEVWKPGPVRNSLSSRNKQKPEPERRDHQLFYFSDREA